MTEEGEIIIAEVDMLADLFPVKAGSLSCRHPENNQKDQQQDSSNTDSGGARALSLGLLILDEFDYTPQNDQRRPVSSEPTQKRLGVQHVHRGQQKHDSQQD